MKKLLTICSVIALSLGLVACGETAESNTSVETTDAEISAEENTSETVEEVQQTEDTSVEEDSVLVVYFSVTGNTKDIAEKIASVTNADIYEIVPAQEYTDDDINWHDDNSRTSHEQNDPAARPEIASDPVSLEGYSIIYIGFPIWWGEEPRIMDTFVEQYNFDGINMIPFCTSGSSGIGNSGKNLEENAGSGNWLEGQRFGAGTPESEIQSWIDGLQ